MPLEIQTARSMGSRILIVDDTPANIQALVGILKDKGYQTSVATNGKQAIDLLARANTPFLAAQASHVPQ